MHDIPYHHNNKDHIAAEYIWLDGHKPTAGIRGKTKILMATEKTIDDIVFPVWAFDGSSTEQALGHDSDCILKPVRVFYDPFRNNETEIVPNVIVLAEVETRHGEPHPSNTRARLRRLAEQYEQEKFWFGIEQEYTFFKGDRPLGFPPEGLPEAQGKYYCGVGAGSVMGRELVEKHHVACLEAGLLFDGINAEVMPGQWEYQIGPGSPLTVADHLTVARYLLARLGEEYDITVSLAAKPMKEPGEWNGAGAHTNFSTKGMREGTVAFDTIIEKLRRAHNEHIKVYGEDIQDRLTGKCETAAWNEFTSGISDRGASIRIPWKSAQESKGYLEDRRPCANIDPYLVISRIIETVAR